ncbi:MAG: tRNA glutamyl-Q(34) synthetase GluQRS [Bosea sp. (in: a-proteobacteria)]
MMREKPPVFRFAPSPNGWLHLGHARSAILNFRAAQATGGRFLLRIEDIDPDRAKPEHVEGLLDDLRWLGLEWEEPVWRQSAQFETYRAALERLREQELVYPCFCSRGDIARKLADMGDAGPRDQDGTPHYPGTCRGMSAELVAARLAGGEKPAMRLYMAKALERLGAEASQLSWQELDTPEGELVREEIAHPEAWGDVILGRSIVPTSYHLSVVLDDAAQDVTHVVRGVDLFHATGLHRLLQVLLGLPAPIYHHHRLILDDDGRKLSKSRGSMSLKTLRAEGASQVDVLRMIGLD